VARESSESTPGQILAIAFAAILGASLCIEYSTTCFVPSAVFVQNADTYDAFRYDWMASHASSWPIDRIAVDEVPLKSPGYFRFLAAFYHYWGPDTLAGCVVNWLMWLAAGWLLAVVAAEDHSHPGVVRLVFAASWLLLPDAIDWTGTTSKEPLCVLAIACSLRLARYARLASWLALLPCAGAVALLAVAGNEVRGALLPMIALPFAVSVECRLRRPRIPWTLVVVLAAIVLGYVGETGAFSMTGQEFARSTWGQGFSSDSVLLRIGSSNRWIDLLAVPIRGLAHLVVPLNTAPQALPLAMVASPSLLGWASAALYVVLAAAVVLRVREARRWKRRLPATEVVLLSACGLGVVLLGLTGIIHERYRSLFVPAFLPLASRHAVDEVRKHGWRRIGVTLAAGGIVASVGYLGLKFLL
jgi:hypothetical protein